MTWLYVPTVSPSAQELEGSNLACLSRSMNIEPSVTWRGKPFPPRSWSKEWKRCGWIKLLSGLTYEPSTVLHGVASQISYLRDSHVSHIPKLGSEDMKKMIDGSGPISLEPLKWLVLPSFSLRTSTSEPSSNRTMTFKQWASKCRTPLPAQPPRWVRDILEDESSFLPTTSATSYGNNRGGSAGRVGKVRQSLDRLLATPSIKGEYNRKGASEKSGNGLATQLGGAPNPNWKEWFMGFPIGWTAIEHLATASYLLWLHTLSQDLHKRLDWDEDRK